MSLLSVGPAPLTGTLHGTFFAHAGSPRTGPLYSVFASGGIAPVGGSLLVGGFESAGFTASGAGGGNITLATKTRPGNIFVRLSAPTGPAEQTADEYTFAYVVNHGTGSNRGVHGSGTLEVSLEPVSTSIHGQPVSNPRFFGNATLSFG
jgi:hypothetical protein